MKQKIKIITSSWDDGTDMDIRLSQLLLEYQIPATFYIPTNCQLSPIEIKELARNFGIGGHTASHPEDIKKLNDKDAYWEIASNKEWLQEMIGRQIKYFAYPSGRYDDRIVKLVKKADYKFARTTNIGNCRMPADNLRIDTTMHIHPKNDWFIFCSEILSDPLCEYFHIWGHSAEINKYNLWNSLEKLFQIMQKKC